MIKLNIQRFGNKSNVVGGNRQVEVTGSDASKTLVEFTSKQVDNSIFGTLGNEREIRSLTSGMVKSVEKLSETNSLLTEQERLLKHISKMEQETLKNRVESSAVYRNLQADMAHYEMLQSKAKELLKSQNIDAKELVEIYRDLLKTQTSVEVAQQGLVNATDATVNNTNKLNSELKITAQNVKDTANANVELADKAIARLDLLNSKTKTFSEAVSDSLSTISNEAAKIIGTFSLEKLANGIGRSTKAQLETQLRQDYGLSGSQFSAFKSGIYNSFDRGLFSATQVQQTMSTLNEIGVRVDEVPKYFETIIQGQHALGMTASTQAALMELTNKTGRDQLTLGTQTFAKYLKSIDNLSRSQLNELVTLNASYQSEAASLGVNSSSFDRSTAAIAGALAKASGGTGLSNLFNQVSSGFMSSTESAANALGITSGQYKQSLNAGNTLFDLLQGGTGRLGNYYKTLLNNPEYAYQYQDELTQGLDTSSVQLVNQMVQLQREGKLTNSLIEDFKNMTSAELDKALEDYKDSISTTEKALNSVQNTFDQLTSWNWWSSVQNNVQGILNLLMVISGVLSVKNSVGNIANLFKGAGTAAGTASATSAGASGLAKFIPGIGSALWMSVDAYQGFANSQNTGWAKAGDTLATMVSGTGTNLGGSLLSGAGKGALLGTAIAPGIGTAIGAAVGGGLGILANFWKTDQAKKQQDTLEAIEDNTKSTATATQALSVTDRYIKSVIPMGGDEYGYSTGRTYSHSPKPSLPWGSITSWYGTRTDPITGAKGKFHSGIDIGARAGTSIGAAYNGTVVGKGHNSSMGNWISIKDDNGKTHTYMHMISGALPEVGEYVSQGQIVGYIGSTGNSTGPHLHYSVNTGTGYNRTTSVDPYEYMLNSGIFGATGSASTSSASSTSSSSSSMIDKVSQLIQMDAIGGDTGNPVVNSIQDLKQTIIDLSNRTTANEKLMRSIAGTYTRDPRVG